jgi:hypothetical protein
MHFQCVTIAYVTSQQIYFISHFITRLLKPKSAYLTAKVDIGFFLFMMSFGIPTTFINTSKINEFSPPWREGESMPLAWRCVIGDTALLWIISIALVAWVSTEFVVLYNRFGIRDMWHVSLPLLNKEPAHSEDGIADEYSITHKHSDSLDSLRP